MIPHVTALVCVCSCACVCLDARERGAAAGSKIKVTSIIHMAWELAALLLAYQVGPTRVFATAHGQCSNQPPCYCCDPS